eukprot:m.251980 g.251980  ORF g.251980 m.251980 type:complete len:897 (-) comp26702_c2_seq15:63-2753(-)
MYNIKGIWLEHNYLTQMAEYWTLQANPNLILVDFRNNNITRLSRSLGDLEANSVYLRALENPSFCFSLVDLLSCTCAQGFVGDGKFCEPDEPSREIFFGGKSAFEVFPLEETWEKSFEFASKQKYLGRCGRLAVPDTRERSAASKYLVLNYVNTTFARSSYFLGGTDTAEEGTWRWIDDLPQCSLPSTNMLSYVKQHPEPFQAFWEGQTDGRLLHGVNDWRTVILTGQAEPNGRGRCTSIQYTRENFADGNIILPYVSWFSTPCTTFLPVLVEYPEVYAMRNSLDTCVSCFCASRAAACDNRHIDTIPQDLPPNTRLLFASFNRISILNRGDFTSLQQLEGLFLADNEITMIKPGTFSSTPQLKTLVLSGNLLSGLYSGVFTLPRLELLDVNTNPLREVSATAFSDLDKIDFLMAQANDLSCSARVPGDVRCFCVTSQGGPGCPSCTTQFNPPLPAELTSSSCSGGVTGEQCFFHVSGELHYYACANNTWVKIQAPTSTSFSKASNSSLLTKSPSTSTEVVVTQANITDAPAPGGFSSRSGAANNDTLPVVIAVSSCGLIFLLVTALCLIRRRQRRVANAHSALRAQELFAENFQNVLLDVHTDVNSLLIDSSSLVYDKKIGEGNFGVVHKATFRGQEVAVKRLNIFLASSMRVNFMLEACLLASLKHDNIVRLIGVGCTPVPLIVTEYMPGGDLSQYLRACRPTSQPCKEVLLSEDLIGAAVSICKAMVFLERNNLVHRDVACRNCLVGQSVATVKLGDFGMARRLSRKGEQPSNPSEDAPDYYYRQSSEDPIAVRWMAPESIRSKTFSLKSDVWSFAVLLWELFTLGQTPFGKFSGLQLVMQIVNQEERLPKPRLASDEIYDVMLQCWQMSPDQRPTFTTLLGLLEEVEPESAV